jgi:hypothetical protein
MFELALAVEGEGVKSGRSTNNFNTETLKCNEVIMG